MAKIGVIIAAAGGGTRMGGDKMLMRLPNGQTVLESSTLPFLNCNLVDEVIVSTSADKVKAVADLFSSPKIKVIKAEQLGLPP